MQVFILELAAGDFRIINSNEEVGERESDEHARAAPKINSGATDGGYFLGRPMEPESGPAKTRKPQAELHFKQYGLGKVQARKPATS